MTFLCQNKHSTKYISRIKQWFSLYIYIAIWTILKALLPAKAVELVKFVDKKSIKDYIADDQLFIHMGGTVKTRHSRVCVFVYHNYSKLFLKDLFEYSSEDPDLYIHLENAQLRLK